MSKYLLSAPVVALMATAVPAQAQDADWTGFYAGAHGAVAVTESDWDGSSIFQTVDGGEGGFTAQSQTVPFTESPTDSGVAGGVRAGYNWQAGNFVFGVEADATFFDLDSVAIGGNAAGPYTLTSSASNLETIRARAGVSLGSAMIFATGGVAFSDLDHTLSAVNTSAVIVDGGEGGSVIGTAVSNLSSTAGSSTGLALGGGGEVFLSENLTLGLTLLHVDFGSEDLVDAAATNGVGTEVDSSIFVGTLGLNLRF